MSRGLAGILILTLLPIIIGIAAVLCFGRDPIFFCQQRIGRGGQSFLLFKFRTMTEVDGKVRVTKSGKFLRRTGLDEIPQLLNILKGEMSFIGPRPLPVSYLNLLSSTENQRHIVLPGITGLAQIKGRNALTWDEKFYWDLYYVENMSWKLNAFILFNTFRVLTSEGGVMIPLSSLR